METEGRVRAGRTARLALLGATGAGGLAHHQYKANTTSIVYLAGLNFYWRRYVKVGANTGARHDLGPRAFSSLFLAQVMLSF